MENRAKLMALIGDSRRLFGAMPVAGLMMAVGWSAPTMADTAMQTYDLDLKRCSAEMPLPDGTTECDLTPYYVECLNEYLVGEYHVAGKHQEFETSSGTAHVRDNWKIISMFFGVTTGRAWYGVGVSPARARSRPSARRATIVSRAGAHRALATLTTSVVFPLPTRELSRGSRLSARSNRAARERA